MARGPSARRYAQAVFQLAVEGKNLDGWADDLGALARASENAEFAALLDAPHLPLTQKRKLISDVLGKAVSPLPLNLISLLASRNYVRLIPDILDEYERLVYAHRGIVLGEVISAVPLDPQQLDVITKRISQIVGRQVKVTTRVDPSVLGGFVARVGDRVLDGSAKTKLQQMRQSLASGVV
jgi:F-type H+-transporting ATPase subunit delta